MTDDELLALSKEILERIEQGEKNQDVFLVQMQMLRMISHIRSEQRTAVTMAEELKLLNDAIFGSKEKPENSPGIVLTLREMKDSMATNRKIHAAIVSGVGALVLKSLYDLITKGHP